MAENTYKDAAELSAALRANEGRLARYEGALRQIAEALGGKQPPGCFVAEPELIAAQVADLKHEADEWRGQFGTIQHLVAMHERFRNAAAEIAQIIEAEPGTDLQALPEAVGKVVMGLKAQLEERGPKEHYKS